MRPKHPSRCWKLALIASAAVCAAAPALAQESGGPSGDSVTLYGIVDAAIRHDTNSGTSSGNPGQSSSSLIGGGMAESEWGIRTSENLGGGLRINSNIEQRLRTQDGSIIGPDGTNSGFHIAWVGISSSQWGSLTLGRQWNVILDLAVTTFSDYPYSPYFDGFKPGMGFTVGARNDDMVKYTYGNGPWTIGLQYGRAPVDSPTGGDTRGGYVRWSGLPGFAIGAGYLDYEFGSGKRINVEVLGGSWTNGSLYLMGQYIQNKTDAGLDPTDQAVLDSLWTGATSLYSNYGSPAFVSTADKRGMWQLGGGYKLTPALRFDLYLYHVRQTGVDETHDTWNMWSAALDYAFSKRTDAYVEMDRIALSGNDGIGLTSTLDGSPNGERNRTGFSIGLRHRF